MLFSMFEVKIRIASFFQLIVKLSRLIFFTGISLSLVKCHTIFLENIVRGEVHPPSKQTFNHFFGGFVNQLKIPEIGMGCWSHGVEWVNHNAYLNTFTYSHWHTL